MVTSIRSFSVVLAAVCALAPAVSGQVLEENARTRYHAAIEAAAATVDSNMVKYNVPGTILVIVNRDSILFEAGYGYADVQKGTRPDPGSTTFRIASVSKPFTALAALHEIELGRLSLTDNVADMLPEGMLDNRTGTPLTLHHLLTHTGGVDRRNYGTRAVSAAKVEPLGVHLAHALPPVVRTPGEALIYSNYGFTLVGYLVERSSGEAFPDYVKQTIFDPLGMSHSTFDVNATPPGLATGYVNGRAIGAEPGHTVPAGQMITTGEDMARFMIAVLNGGALEGRQVLDANALRQMMQPRFRNAPGLPMAYGYGMWISDQRDDGFDSVSHTGDMRGWSAAVEMFPDANLGVFMASNSAQGENVHAHFVRDLIARLTAAPEPPVDEIGPFDRLSDHRAYIGAYLYGGVPARTFDRFVSLMDGAMPVEIGPDGTLLIDHDPYVEVEPGLFRRITDPHPRLAMVEDPKSGRMTVRTSSRTYFEVEDSIPMGTQRLALLVSLATLAVSLIIWGVQSIRRRKRRPPDRWLRTLAGLCGLCYVVFFVGFAGHAILDVNMNTGVPGLLKVLLGLASLGAVLAVALPLVLLRVLTTAKIPAAARVHYIAFTVAALLVTAIFWHWNVIGMKV